MTNMASLNSQGASSSQLGWESFLADFESQISENERLFPSEAQGDNNMNSLNEMKVQPFVPPENLGPLPAELKARAVELLARSTELEKLMQNQLASLAEMIRNTTQATRRSPFGDSPEPRYFDSSV